MPWPSLACLPAPSKSPEPPVAETPMRMNFFRRACCMVPESRQTYCFALYYPLSVGPASPS